MDLKNIKKKLEEVKDSEEKRGVILEIEEVEKMVKEIEKLRETQEKLIELLKKADDYSEKLEWKLFFAGKDKLLYQIMKDRVRKEGDRRIENNEKEETYTVEVLVNDSYELVLCTKDEELVKNIDFSRYGATRWRILTWVDGLVEDQKIVEKKE